MKFVVPGELPTMNEIIAESKKHWSRYSKMKKEYTWLVASQARKLPKMEKINLYVTWYCQSRRIDKDNILAGLKFIMDGLVEAGVISNDGWAQIGEITPKFKVDRDDPRVEVRVETAQGGNSDGTHNKD